MGRALASAGILVVSVSGRDQHQTRRLAERLSTRALVFPQVDLSADLILLTVTDSALEDVCRTVFDGQKLSQAMVVHLAASRGLDVLAQAASAGGRIGKLHPVASLAGGAQPLDGVAWGIEAEGVVFDQLQLLVERLRGLPFDLAGVDLFRYHLAAVFASNFVIALLDTATTLWEQSQAPVPSVEALGPLVRGTLDNWESMGSEAALTGPISRGDPGAVVRQLSSLVTESPQLKGLYRELSLATADIASRRDGPSARLAEIARLLAETDMID